jgi:hypothetical protein
VDLLTSAVILVACISVGLCGIIISGRRVGASKHTRAYVKDIQQDLNYVKEQKNQEIKELRHEQQRLKGIINKNKQGPALTEKELTDGSGIGEVLIKKFGLGKYIKYLPKGTIEQVEKGIIDNKDEIINAIRQNNKPAQSQAGTYQDSTSL